MEKKGPKVRKKQLWVSGTTEGATDLSSGARCVPKRIGGNNCTSQTQC